MVDKDESSNYNDIIDDTYPVTLINQSRNKNASELDTENEREQFSEAQRESYRASLLQQKARGSNS